MTCATLPKQQHRELPGFRLRGGEVTRLEAFSDGVFAFALTLLVVSLDVPKTFEELIATMRGFPAFAVCFALLALIWNQHYKFSRRYGLQDGTSRFLTCIMLFLVLFYVYPLKFLFNISITNTFFGSPSNAPRISLEHLRTLFVIFGIGFSAVYLALTLLHVHAWRLRDVLELSALEKFDTRSEVWRLLMLVAVGILAALLACIPPVLPWSSLIYLTIFPLLRIQRNIHRRRRMPLYLAEQA